MMTEVLVGALIVLVGGCSFLAGYGTGATREVLRSARTADQVRNTVLDDAVAVVRLAATEYRDGGHRPYGQVLEEAAQRVEGLRR